MLLDVVSWDRLADFIPSVYFCCVCLMLLVGTVQAWPSMGTIAGHVGSMSITQMAHSETLAVVL